MNQMKHKLGFITIHDHRSPSDETSKHLSVSHYCCVICQKANLRKYIKFLFQFSIFLWFNYFTAVQKQKKKKGNEKKRK